MNIKIEKIVIGKAEFAVTVRAYEGDQYIVRTGTLKTEAELLAWMKEVAKEAIALFPTTTVFYDPTQLKKEYEYDKATDVLKVK